MEIKYIPDGTITEKQQKDVDIINGIAFGGDPNEPEVEFDINTYEWSAPADGMFVLLDGERIVGIVSVHKTLTEYNGQEYYLGGFGGLAVLPEYRGKSYGRKLAEAALAKSYEIGIAVACMCVDMKSGITDFYQKLGFKFLNRPAYFINHGNNEVTDDTVMIMGLHDKNLADEILKTNYKFHYGKSKGHW
jgi:predicted N-acetyltransferase YhbS